MWLYHTKYLPSTRYDKHIGRYSNKLKCNYSIDKKPSKFLVRDSRKKLVDLLMKKIPTVRKTNKGKSKKFINMKSFLSNI